MKKKQSTKTYFAKYIKIIFMILGCFYIAESLSERKIPEIRHYDLNHNPEITSHSYLTSSDSDQEKWEALSVPLEILENINPKAHKWILNLYKNKKIKFTSDSKILNQKEQYFCKYDWINGNLKISNSTWLENDGTIAVLFCHEYRHSLQSYFKRFRYVISFVFYKEGNEAIIENDAYLYEQEAFISIFKIEYPF